MKDNIDVVGFLIIVVCLVFVGLFVIEDVLVVVNLKNVGVIFIGKMNLD